MSDPVRKLTKEQFMEMVEDVWSWIGETPRPQSSWWLSMRQFSQMQFDACYKAEEEKRREAKQQG